MAPSGGGQSSSDPPVRQDQAARDAWEARDLGALYRLHVSDVARWVRRMGGFRIGVEDAVHDVFLVAMRRVHDFDPGRAAFATWLYGITTKVMRSKVRKEMWRARLLSVLPWWTGHPSPQAESSSGDTAAALDDGALHQQAAERTLHAIVDRLPERYRTPLVMFELEGRPCAEIAILTSTSIENVYVRIHRGRQKLAAELVRHRAEGRSGDG